jgi:hypothetical protein
MSRFPVVAFGAVLVLGAVASSAVQAGSPQDADVSTAIVETGLSKPGPDVLAGSVGTVVADNSQVWRSIVPATPASVVFGKSPPVISESAQLKGYVVKDTGPLVSHSLSQESGEVTCPKNKVALSGGVFGDSTSLAQLVWSSNPMISNGVADGWAGGVDNVTSSDSTFSVYVVCAARPAEYVVLVSFFNPNPTMQQSRVTLTCPPAASGKRMKIFGGGAFGYSDSLFQHINSTFPVARTRSWRVDMNNESDFDEMFDVYAICGVKAGWAVVVGSVVSNPAKTLTFAHSICPSGKTAVGGGIFSSSASVQVSLNATAPESSFGWENDEANATNHDHTVTPYAVCLA